MSRITIAGLGPDSSHLPSILSGSTNSFAWLPIDGVRLRLPEPASREDIEESVRTIFECAARSDASYVGPGAPLGDDPVAEALVRECRKAPLDFDLIEAPPLWWANRPDAGPFSIIAVDDIDAADLSRTSIVAGIVGSLGLQNVVARARRRSEALRLSVVPWDSAPIEVTLADDIELPELPSPAHACSVVMHPLAATDEPDSVRSLLEIVARLRAPDGCPWDREQTHDSLRRHMIEEAYEAVEAIDRGGGPKLAAELGDVLVQIALHSQIASESGDFTFSDVVASISTKLIRRHPHVFGDVKVDGSSDVLSNWERIKAEERGHDDFLDGLPKALPSLAYAREALSRAGRLNAEVPPLHIAQDPLTAFVRWLKDVPESEREAALGGFILALVKITSDFDLDPELALAAENRRFRRRVSRSVMKGQE